MASSFCFKLMSLKIPFGTFYLSSGDHKGEMKKCSYLYYRSETNGVMVPPVIVDINKDGVKDILMSAFDGTMILFDGETLDVLWKIKFEDKESYRYLLYD